MKHTLLAGYAVVVALVLPCAVANAQAPVAGAVQSGVDAKLSVIPYSAMQVVKIWGRFGFTTSVVFAPDEKVESIAVGYPEAWEVTQLGNRLVLKPRARNGQTNLTVVTNRRTYYFDLDVASAKNLRDVRHAIQFSYEGTTEEQSQYLDLLRKIETQQTIIAKLEQGLQERAANRNYTYVGSSDVAPFEAWDDGRFTYFRFADNQAMPAIYAVDGHGNESLVNFTVAGNVTIVRSVGRQFRLRRGPDVACVFNESDLQYEFRLDRSGTVSDDVKRTTQ